MTPAPRKHVVIVTYHDYPSFDGLSTRVANLSRAYAAQGAEVTVFAPNIDLRQEKSEVVDQRQRIVRTDIPLLRLLSRSRIVLRLYATLVHTLVTFRHYPRLKRGGIDTVQAQQFYGIPPALVLKLICRARVVADDVTTVSDILRDTGHRVLARIFTRVERVFFSLCDDFIYTSEVCREYCQARGREAGIRGPNGVDCERFRPAAVAAGRPVVFFNCSTYYHQNINAIELFIEVCRELRERTGAPFLFHLVCGPLQQVPQALLERAEELKGHLLIEPSVQRIEEKIQEAAVTLLPYRAGDHITGGVRLKALEYMACGKPVISTPEGIEGIEGVRDGRELLVAGGKEEMVAALLAYLAAPQRFAGLAAAGRSFVEERYDWRAIGKDILAKL